MKTKQPAKATTKTNKVKTPTNKPGYERVKKPVTKTPGNPKVVKAFKEDKNNYQEDALLERLSMILLGEKIPLDICHALTGEILIPANRRITKMLLKKVVKARFNLDIDPSPIRNKIREVLFADPTAAEPERFAEVEKALEEEAKAELVIETPAAPPALLVQEPRANITQAKQLRRARFKADYIRINGRKAWVEKMRAKRRRYHTGHHRNRSRNRKPSYLLPIKYRPYSLV